MRAFTLDLSKEAMLFLQLKLPKGYSLVKTAKETKKGSKIVKNSTISQEEIHRDSTSQEFDPSKRQPTTKTSKASVAKTKEEPRMQIAKKQPKLQSYKIKIDSVASKKPQTIPKKGKQEPQIYDSNSEEDTTSESKNNHKAKIKQSKLKDKTQLKDAQKAKESVEKSALNSMRDKENDNEISKDYSQKTDQKEIPPKIGTIDKSNSKLEEQNGNNSNKKYIQQKAQSANGQINQNLLKTCEEIDKKTEGKKKTKKIKSKKYSHDDRLQIIIRIRKLDRQTMSEFFKSISFSKGETLDFKLMEDEKIKPIEEELIKYEEIYKQRMRQEIERLRPKNPKSLDDFEVAEDNDYND